MSRASALPHSVRDLVAFVTLSLVWIAEVS